MPLELQAVTSDTDFDEFIPVQWAAYEDPPYPFFHLFCPTRGTHPTARAESLQEAKERQIQWTHADPTSQWLKVIDTDTAKIVAAGMWHVHEADPYANSSDTPFEAAWWPEGSEGKKYTELCIGEYLARRKDRMRKPHLLLERCFTHPSHRRRGAGHLIVDWGVAKADELGLEAFVEATNSGASLYKAHGFIITDEIKVDTKREGSSEEWKRLEKEFPVQYTFMWRPKDGKFEKGKTVIPWKQ